MPLRTLQCHNPGLMALDNAQIASASLGMLLPLLGGLAVWPLYAFAKRISNVRVAALTVLLFPLLPLFALWMSQWDQVYPLLLFLGLYLAHTGLEKKFVVAHLRGRRAAFDRLVLQRGQFCVDGDRRAVWCGVALVSACLRSVPPSLTPSVSPLLSPWAAPRSGCCTGWSIGVNPLECDFHRIAPGV